MTIRELAENLILHSDEKLDVIDLGRATEIIGWLDPDSDLPEDLTPEAFMEEFNDLVKNYPNEDIERGAKPMINVALSNKDCIFDSGNFETIEQAVTFSRKRGGKYVVHICADDQLGNSYSYDSDTDKFLWFDGYEWIQVKPEKLL